MKNNGHSVSRHLLRSIKNFFSVEPLWKLFSLAAAVFMWFIVMNIINPTEVKTFQASVTLENMSALTEQGYMVSNLEEIEKYTVSVKVEATRPALDELSKSDNKNNIRARIDLSKIEINENDEFPKRYSLVVTPSLPSNMYVNNYDVLSYYPTACEVEIDKAASKTVPVEIKTYGTAASGYTAEEPVSDVKEAVVTGPQHKIFDANKAVATIDVTGQKQSINESCDLVVYDEDDAALEGFIVDPESINVGVEIRKNHTVEIEEPRTVGDLPDYLELLSVDWEPKSINVTSENENALESVSLPVIDLTEISETTTRVIDISDILENAGFEADSSQKNVTVTINIGLKSAEKYTIPSESIRITGLGADLEAEISADVTLEIGGADNINVYSLMPYVDLSGLAEGKHTVKLNINLPQGAVMSEEPSADVNITKRKSDSSITETETEETTAEETESTTEITESESVTEETEE